MNDKFRTIGCIKQGALAEEILVGLTVDIVKLKKRDVIVISVGAKDLYMNNPNEALMKIINFIQMNSNTNIMMFGIPHIHDLVEYSYLNRAIQVFNHKLKKVAN
jgi:hypothetical protein